MGREFFVSLNDNDIIIFPIIYNLKKIMSFNNLLAVHTFTPSLTLTNSLSGSTPVSMASPSTGATSYTIVWPNAAGTIGQSLVVASVSGSLVNLTWTGGSFDAAPSKPSVRVSVIEKK